MYILYARYRNFQGRKFDSAHPIMLIMRVMAASPAVMYIECQVSPGMAF